MRGCDLPSHGGNLLGCRPDAHTNVIRSDKSGDGFQAGAGGVGGGEGQERSRWEPEAVRPKRFLTAVSAESESRVRAGIRFFFLSSWHGDF